MLVRPEPAQALLAEVPEAKGGAFGAVAEQAEMPHRGSVSQTWPVTGYPSYRQVVLDCTDCRALAEFYRQLLGFTYRPGDADSRPGEDWLVIHDSSGANRIAFQQVDELPRSTWPEDKVPQQLHIDFSVPSAEELARQHERALALGATVLYDRSAHSEEPLWVFADPEGHPFCIFVAPS